MRTRSFSALALALGTWLAIVIMPALAAPQRSVELSVDIESAMPHATALPDDVFHLLASHQDVHDELENEAAATAEAMRSFEAARVNINNDGIDDLIVRNPRMDGANIGPFWVFVATGHGHRLVFFTRCHCLTVLKGRRGYRELEASKASAVTGWVTVYKHMRGRYEARRCTRSDLATGKTETVRCVQEPEAASEPGAPAPPN